MSGEIKIVMRCANGMVVVFNAKGKQMSEYQGHYSDVKCSILSDAPKDCRFETYWPSFVEVSRDRW